ncbi:putative sugar phosphate/phosphate translocator [Citrus sinensis]|uniref:Sugar phosphate/phosphate translocator n=1 Tax=Citrus sinensis TaxID=2711 RepID=A0ACB8P5Z6_CITSI|nr:putative sugar phosphate/phosphate translocator [Citrus sinensis]
MRNTNCYTMYLPASLNQAIGVTTPFFNPIFTFLITCKKESPRGLLWVDAGCFSPGNNEPLFLLFGFLVVLCIGFTARRALKSVVQRILLTLEAEKLNSMNLLLYMVPMAASILLPFTLYIEGNIHCVLVTCECHCCLFVNMTNFLVTKHTSTLALQVLGNTKTALVAVVSVLIFRNPVIVIGMTELAVTVMVMVRYSEAKKRFKVPTH